MRRFCPIALILLFASAFAFGQTSATRLPVSPKMKPNEELLGGPMIVNIGPKTATLAWITKTRGRELVKAPNRVALKRVTRSERLTFKGLQPGVTYTYDFNGAPGHFKTPPAGPATIHFAVFGDTRTRHDVHRKVVAEIVKQQPDFVIHTGDFVVDGQQTSLWPVFFDIERDLLRSAAFLPTPGNHEHNCPQYFAFFQVKPYYSMDWGSTHVAMLDSDINNVSTDKKEREKFWNEQMKWLDEDLAKAVRADLRIVAFHHPPFSAMSKRGINEQTARLVPLFEKHRVSLVFSGHDHNYQHFLKNGVHYIVTGGGGAPLYPLDAPLPEITLKIEATEHFMDVKVDGGKAVLRALALDGREIDRIELEAPAQRASTPSPRNSN